MIHLTPITEFIAGLIDGFGMAILFVAMVVVFLIALTEWLFIARMP